MNRTFFILTILALIIFLGYNSCQHEPEDTVGPGPGPTNCDTSNVTYPGTVYPILDQYCISCHSGSAPQGGLDFTDYSRVAFVAESGTLLGAIKHQDGYSWMPKDLPQLDACRIRQIEIWIRDTTFTPPPDPTHPCDPDTIYFEMDVLPILNSSCAKSPHNGMNCHDSYAEEDVRLDSYAAVMASGVIVPFNPGESELYEKITETDPEDVMPPPAAGDQPLNSTQKEIIRKWIAQGAQNLYCDEMCDTSNVTFSGTIWPQIIQKNCFGCHNGANASGGIHLENHGQVAAAANIPAGQPGSLWGAITWAGGNARMPKNQPQLTDCKIAQIKKWIDAGTPDN
jgi:mono/diheme cytochrome c family protein